MSYVAKNIGFPNGDPRNASGSFGGEAFRKEAAGALADMNIAFRKRFGVDIPVSEGMRGIDRQNFYYDRYINRRPGWTVAAYPGTSNHGWGLAADFGSPINSSSSEMHKWLQANAAGYGWFWAGVDFGEPWHWEYDGRNVDDARAVRYNSDTPIQEEGLLMALTPDQQKQVHTALVSKQGWYWPEAIINVIRTEVNPKLQDLLNGKIKFPGQAYNAFDALANEIRSVRDNNGRDIKALSDKLDAISAQLKK